MATAVLDTHRIVKRLQDAGASEKLAETVTDVLRETRELDLSDLATTADLALVRTDIESLRSATKADIESLRAATKADVALLRADLAGTEAKLRQEIAEAKADQIKWTIGVGLVQGLALVGALITILRFLPGGAP